MQSSEVWWVRVRRAADRRGAEGKKLMSDWSHDMLEVLGAEGNEVELVPGAGWQPIPPERFTAEYKAAATRRLRDELGRALGVGPMP